MAVGGLLLAGTNVLPFAACGLAVLLLGLIWRLARGKPEESSFANDPRDPPEKCPWVLQFPPSRRFTLADLGLKGAGGPYLVPSPDVLRRRAVTSTQTAKWDEDDLYTPTGFSTQDIRALGRFPDYSALTGVRYPQPYGSHFDISKAIFRPFRPFRWTYHQTMGKTRGRIVGWDHSG